MQPYFPGFRSFKHFPIPFWRRGVSVPNAYYKTFPKLAQNISLYFRSMGSAASGGTDLNMEGGVSDYFKDVIIVTCVVMILSLLSDYFW